MDIRPASNRGEPEDVASFYDQAEDASDEHHAGELFELSQIVRRLLRTFRRSARRGRLTPSTMTKVRSLLEDTTRKLEALLDEH